MTPSPLLNAADIRSLLAALGAELERRGVLGELYLVGGAALALAYDGRRVTRDLDAVFAPVTEIRQAALAVADAASLPDDWLNDAVKGLVPGLDPDQCTVFSAPGLSVSVPSPRHLLAMKVAASRVDRDIDDIRFLADLCGLTTSMEVLEATVDVWGSANRIPPKASFLVQEIFGPLDKPLRDQ